MDRETRRLLLSGNAGVVLAALLEHEPISAMELSDRLGTSWLTVASGLDDLKLLGLATSGMTPESDEKLTTLKRWWVVDRALAERELQGGVVGPLGPRSRVSPLAERALAQAL